MRRCIQCKLTLSLSLSLTCLFLCQFFLHALLSIFSNRQDKPKKQDDDEPQQLDSNAINSGLDEKTGRAVNQKKKESSMEAKPSAATAKLTKESGKKIASASNAKPSVPPTKRSTSEIKATKQSEKPTSLGDNKKVRCSLTCI